ncbi:hypothetical protein K388_07463 [Streptomyces sp. KhCrAH-43]|uniref:hypothetical protein n=1 Tax=unclassified Streptomyces TaxID=2593676 RepID=UPI000374D0FF|nr:MULTISPECIES: hypothetical protein [unclassified Streptomyces]MYS37216.1 hypothetical protein [Streptomyces sp. SID4920]MYX67195.1 hypothetical protein [Streptomyces sp. SID8373]RAJ42995.1 hypothetical protein K388_07463 [Streptomyces sp. KhCrAH-43]
MSRTRHHRHHLPARKGNPARLMGMDDRAAVRAGILTTTTRDEYGYPQFADRAMKRAQAQDAPGKRKAYQKAAHRRDRAATRAALATTQFQRDPASRQVLRLERALTPVTRRRVDDDIS